MATKPTHTAQDTLTDAWQMLRALRNRWEEIAQASEGKTVKLIEEGWPARFEADLNATDAAVSGQTTTKESKKLATEREVELRADLFDQFVAIRDDITLAYPGNRALGRAVGVGAKVSRKSTREVVKIAGAIVAAFTDPEDPEAKERMQKAIAAGVTLARMKAFEAGRVALGQADTTQVVKIAVGKGNTLSTGRRLSQVKAGTAHIREVAAHVFRGRKDVLAEFGIKVVTRRKPVKRAKKTKKPLNGGE